MPNLYSTCNWNMTGAQIITPTSSALAAINAIQAAVTASVHWTVNSTGTTTAGYKYVEVKPSNPNSIYKDYRILFVERVNNSTNKSASQGTGIFNSATNLPVYFAPDGGSSWSTFTPANIDSSNPPYVGSRYRFGTSSATVYRWAGALVGPWTATWLYECDGGMWLINRSGVTSHQIMGIGSIFVPSRASLTDFNEGGTEVGLTGVWTVSGLASTAITGGNIIASGTPIIWYQTATGSPPTKSTTSGTLSPASRGTTITFVGAASSNSLYNAEGGLVGMPIQWFSEVSTSANPGNSLYVFRGVYLTTNMKTRTTIQTGSPAATIGYTFFPDDSVTASISGLCLAFMNTP